MVVLLRPGGPLDVVHVDAAGDELHPSAAAFGGEPLLGEAAGGRHRRAHLPRAPLDRLVDGRLEPADVPLPVVPPVFVPGHQQGLARQRALHGQREDVDVRHVGRLDDVEIAHVDPRHGQREADGTSRAAPARGVVEAGELAQRPHAGSVHGGGRLTEAGQYHLVAPLPERRRQLVVAALHAPHEVRIDRLVDDEDLQATSMESGPRSRRTAG